MFLAASGSLAHPVLDARQSTSCATGVHMIVARGSTEPQGEGVESSVVSAVSQSISGSDGEGIVYPASLTDYTSSESQGVTAMTNDIKSYTQQCPDTKIALMGFSQGGQVVADVLGGGSMSSSAAIDKSYTTSSTCSITPSFQHDHLADTIGPSRRRRPLRRPHPRRRKALQRWQQHKERSTHTFLAPRPSPFPPHLPKLLRLLNSLLN